MLESASAAQSAQSCLARVECSVFDDAKHARLQAAPFKLTSEMIDVMGGEHSRHFTRYRDLVIRGEWTPPSLVMLQGNALLPL